jgi:hypothetical protein
VRLALSGRVENGSFEDGHPLPKYEMYINKDCIYRIVAFHLDSAISPFLIFASLVTIIPQIIVIEKRFRFPHSKFLDDRG